MNRRIATVLCTLAWMMGPSVARGQDAPPPVAQSQVVVIDQNAGETRQMLREVLDQYPPTVPQVLALDPTLITNAGFLAPYPQLAAFLAQHPEIARNPTYYFDAFQFRQEQPRDAEQRALSMWEDVLTGAMVFTVFASVAAFLAWLMKTFVDYRRWLHVSRVQTEAHNKLLDRLAGHDDLMAYIQSPSGRRFLEAAPVLEAEPRPTSSPISRVLWSAQIGVVLAFAGIGLAIASLRVNQYIAPPLSTIGVLALSIGVGFILSAGGAYVLSRRLGLIEHRPHA